MTDERFNELLYGPLYHPIISLACTRLVLALRYVVEATGQAGDRALEAHCRDRQARDEAQEW